jgi:4-amino-4-deoxy-L-arabinose transferase-like glycosyltransferase
MSVFFASMTRDKYDSTEKDAVYFILLGVIVIGFLVIGGLYAYFTPPWQTPDEPAHYNYVAQVATGGCCPVITAGDWDADVLETLKAEQFPDNADLTAIEYEDHQPPLYYLIASLIYRFSNGSLFALRMLSVTFGMGVVLAAYFIVARLIPRHKALALATAAFVAFLPQHVAILASVNNDSLAELVLGILMVVTVTYLGNPVYVGPDGAIRPRDESSRPHGAALGGLVGVAFLTKITIYLPAVVIASLAILLCWWRERQRQNGMWLVAHAGWAALLALGFGAIWWVRNGIVYGWPDLLAQFAHDAVVVGQLRTATLIADLGFGPYLKQFLSITYHSYWGQFGWMGVPMPPRAYLLIGLFSLWNLAGIVLLIVLNRDKLRFEPVQRGGLWVLGGVAVITLIDYVGYNLNFAQFQGRYLYPALLVALGSWGWALLIGRWLKVEERAHLLDWVTLIAVAWMPLFAVFALFRYIVPNLG